MTGKLAGLQFVYLRSVCIQQSPTLLAQAGDLQSLIADLTAKGLDSVCRLIHDV